MRQRVPVPELDEDEQPDDARHVRVARARLQRDRHVATAGVDDALREDRAVLGDDVLVLVVDHLKA